MTMNASGYTVNTLWPEIHPEVLNATEYKIDSNIFSTYTQPCRDNYFNLIFLAKELQRFLQITS